MFEAGDSEHLGIASRISNFLLQFGEMDLALDGPLDGLDGNLVSLPSRLVKQARRFVANECLAAL